MIGPYPFFGFPSFRRPYPYYSNYPHTNNVPCGHLNHTKSSSVSGHFSNKAPESCTNFCSASKQIEKQNYPLLQKENTEEEREECFEIFGIKLYFDDLLLIALLFFLYQEEVKDTYLYIALILLLLS